MNPSRGRWEAEEVIGRAVGLIVRHRGVSSDVAASLLEGYAADTVQDVAAVARKVVDEAARMEAEPAGSRRHLRRA